MPKYMFIGSYTKEGAKGVLKEGGSGRRDAAKAVIASAGGTLESYFRLRRRRFLHHRRLPEPCGRGGDRPDGGATGTSKSRTVVLLTPEELDAASNVTVDYRPPGG